MRAILALLFLLGGLNAAHAQCAPPFNWSGFYPPAALDRVAQRTTPGLRSNFEQVLLPRLTDRERQKLGGISLDLSRREYAEHPLNFYAATGGKVVMPLSSVKLVSDLSLALAWYNLKRLPDEKVYDYAAMLAFRGPAPDGVKALPLTALGVPDAADNDPAVEGLFQKLFGTTMVFIMAHETGHLFHGHRANVGEARSRQQEGEADAFAVEMMARMGAPPIGISFYFMMAAPFECADRSTHPLSGERMNRLVAALRNNVSLFARNKPSPQQERQLVESITLELGKVAKLIDDPDIRASMRLAGQSSKVADFAANRSGASRPSAVRQAFDGNYAGQWTDAKGVSLDFRMSLQRQGLHAIRRRPAKG
ncbi:MAG TPA: M48 family metalloprotease, partial [Reyranella sp.]|nr:M48 family metalloprotease [Reyranella sp.]